MTWSLWYEMPSGEDSHTQQLAREIDEAYQEYLSGEPEALYKAFCRQARNCIWWHLLRYDAALEHDIATRATSALKEFRGNSRASTWFYRIAQNEVKRALREQIRARNTTIPLDNPDQSSGERDNDFCFSPGEIENPQEQSKRSSELAKFDVESLKRALPPKQARVISLSSEGYTLKEIAAIEKVSIGTARSRYRLAKDKMAALAKKKST